MVTIYHLLLPLAIRSPLVDDTLGAQLRVWRLQYPAVGKLRHGDAHHQKHGSHKQLHCLELVLPEINSTEIYLFIYSTEHTDYYNYIMINILGVNGIFL